MKHRLLLCLLLFVLPVALRAQETLQPAKTETSDPLPALPIPPYVTEHVPAIKAHLESTRRSQVATGEQLAQAETAAAEEGLAPEEKARRDGEVSRLKGMVAGLAKTVEMLQEALLQAEAGPTQEQLDARREYDRLVSLGERVLRDLVAEPKLEEKQVEGSHARAIREAEEELARIVKLAQQAEAQDVQSSRVFERLSDLEKIEYELRWADQRLKLAIDEYDQIDKHVFVAYVLYEARAVEGLRALRTASEELWGKFAGSPAETMDLGGLPRPTAEVSRLADDIKVRVDRRSGANRSTQKLRISDLEGRLRAVQDEIDTREDFKDRLEQDAERLKEVISAEGSKAKASEPEPEAAVEGELADYQKLGKRIDEIERDIVDYRAQLEALSGERTRLVRNAEQKLGAEREVALIVEKTAARLAELESRYRVPEGATAEERRRIETEAALYAPAILMFVVEQQLEAESERLSAAKRDTRNANTQVEILDKRAERLNERIRELEGDLLPAVRSEYYASIAETFGLRALMVLVVFAIAWLLVKLIGWIGTPLIERVVRRADKKDQFSADEQQRTRTLLLVFMTTARLVVYITAIMFAVAQFDVNYGPLLVAAGGVSLAVGFGAQSLVKDFFAGFFILLEGQYSIGDVVEINGKTGTVENLNLRTTVVRSLNGDVHVIPNGQISLTTNQTKLWSRTIVDVGVAYEENTDDITGVLDVVAREMREDAAWEKKVLEHVIMGVVQLGDSAVVIRVLLKTRAGEQWGASREYLRRVKLKFDELGVEIPWPQRVVSYKADSDDPKEREQEARKKRARVLRYVRRGRGELTDDELVLASMSVEERDRAETIAKRDVELAKDQAESEGESAHAVATERKAEAQADESLSDAEKLAKTLATRQITREQAVPDEKPAAAPTQDVPSPEAATEDEKKPKT